MTYKVPVIGLREDLRQYYPKGTTTLQLILDGYRTATTRSYPCGNIGEIVTFENTHIEFIITNCYKLKDMPFGFTWDKWATMECWNPDYILNNDKLREQCNMDAYQTTFKKIKKDSLDISEIF